MIKRKKGFCKGKAGKYEAYGCGREMWLYSGGLCKRCYILAQSKISSKTKKERNAKIPEILRDAESEVSLFMDVWSNRARPDPITGELKHYSDLSNIEIKINMGDDLWYNCFAHILSKAQGKYPFFKLYEKNIALLTPEEHTLYDHGTESQRYFYAKTNNCSWKKIHDAALKLQREYTIFDL